MRMHAVGCSFGPSCTALPISRWKVRRRLAGNVRDLKVPTPWKHGRGERIKRSAKALLDAGSARQTFDLGVATRVYLEISQNGF